MTAPLFITFEGLDGAGKSSQLATLATYLQQQNLRVMTTREPGGSPLAEQVRSLVLENSMDSITELFLMFAARADHISQVVNPALQNNCMVLCDRFIDASYAYQGGGREIPCETIACLEQALPAHRPPDITFWLDLDYETSLQRRQQSGRTLPDRFDQERQAFFDRVRQGYQKRADTAPGRMIKIDARQDFATVQQQILHVIQKRLRNRSAT